MKTITTDNGETIYVSDDVESLDTENLVQNSIFTSPVSLGESLPIKTSLIKIEKDGIVYTGVLKKFVLKENDVGFKTLKVEIVLAE